MGKFEKGNSGGPGGARPGAGRKRKDAQEAALKVFGGVSEEDLQAIVAKAVEQAKDGDATARAWLSDRVFGKVPSPDVEAVVQEAQEELEEFRLAILETLEEVDPTLRMRVTEKMEAR